VSQLDQVQRAMEETVSALGPVDILHNSAGIMATGMVDGEPVSDTVLDLADAMLRRVLDVNLFGTIYCCKVALSSMVTRKRGVIITTASGAAHVGVAGIAAYTASKGAVASLTRQMMADYSPLGIRVVCISPFRIDSQMFSAKLAAERNVPLQQPIGREGMPADIAHLAVYLASDEASYITGAVFPVDGGYLAT
jgi:NAD(P)-dependent dehydrogenase (short-subunit alcohol dehydrogenase family)